jgi:hypothetical protein
LLTRKVVAGLAAAALLAAGSAFAQTQAPAQASASSGPAGFPVGPLTVFPGIDLAHGYDDNLFLRPTNRATSSFTIFSPYVRAEAKPGPHKFDATLRIDQGRYHSSAADKYTDYSLIGNGDMVFSGRAGLKMRAEHRHGHDARGSTDRGVSATPDEYDNSGVDGVFRYGAPGAQGRIEIDAGAFARRYTNNRVNTEGADRDTIQLGGTFFWRVMPRTELLAQIGHRSIDYSLGSSTLDSTEDRLLVGAKWEATAKTTGTAKFGRQRKKFDSAGRQDLPGTSSWEAGVRWSPLSYSVFDFTSSKQTGETTGVGDTVVSTNYGLTWSHAWSSRLRTQALATFRNDEFVGAGVSRRDDTSSFGLKVAYDFRRWLRLGAEFTHSERDSNDGNFNYKRNLLLFTVGATL